MIADDKIVIYFCWARKARADNVHVSARLHPLTFEDRFGSGGNSADDVSFLYCLLGRWRRSHRQLQFGLRTLRKRMCALGRAPPDRDGLESANLSDRARVSYGLLAIAEQRQPPCIFAGQSVSGDGAGCCCTNCSDLARVNCANRRTGLGIEEDYKSLMRLNAAGEVLWKNADKFRAENGPLAHGARHDAEHAALCQRNDRAQQLSGLAVREGDHGIAHDGDALLVGKPPGDLLSIDESHRREA